MSVPPGQPGSGPTGLDPRADGTAHAVQSGPPRQQGEPAEPSAVSGTEAAGSAPSAADGPPHTTFRPVMVGLALGSLVAVAIGAYAGLHDPTGQAFNLAGFSSGLHAKSWLASVAFALAVVQLISAAGMWGRLPGGRGGAVSSVLHRWSGRLAVVVTLPVAAHCLYALGFQGFDSRVLVHSLLGCFFYGIFVCKMLVLSGRDQPGWVLPVVGGLTFTGLTGLWLTSSLWFFTEFGVSF